MNWFTNLFASSKETRNSKTTMSSTHEAFSLPTSSPGLNRPDAFNPETLQSHTPSSPTSYSYPPPSPGGAYDYLPTSSRSRQSTLLPVHSNPPVNSSYPPLSATWDRLRAWLSNEYPELGDTLNFGILPQDLAQVEASFGFALPQPLRESYLCVDGQEPESSAGCSEGLFFGLTLLPLEDVLEEWKFWREVDEDPNTGANSNLKEVMQSIPPGWVRREYSNRGWIPLIVDKAGNYLGIDMNPDEGGSVGQVIVFGREFDTKVVMWRGDGPDGWARWLAGFVDDLEGGEGFEMGSGGDDNDGSEDSVGYESYFFDGVGRGSGDGGGDAGTGGMRLAGEYKGWSVLEAWADRSVRKWKEAGLVPAPPSSAAPPSKGKVVDKKPPPALNLSASSPRTRARPPAPIFPTDDSSSTTPLGNATNRKIPLSSNQPIPTISVTKAPPPRPVDLPTEDDIVVPIESPLGDLESGTGSAGVMTEVEPLDLAPLRTPTSSIPLRSMVSPPPSAPAVKAAEVPLPSSPPPDIVSLVPPPPRLTVTPVSDLLEDPTPALSTPTIIPSTPGSPNPAFDSKKLEDESSAPTSSEVVEEAPETTIRLVGGGGNSGTIISESPPKSEPVSEPEPEVDTQPAEATAPSQPVAAKTNERPSSILVKKVKHERNKSSLSSNLKKLGLGNGKRKKDSVVSLKGSSAV